VDKEEKLAFNQRNIAEFRASGGKIGSFGESPVLLLTTTGAKSGRRRTTPMMYMADEQDRDRVYVFASAAGADRHPAWYANLLADPADVEVEIGRERVRAEAKSLAEPERAAIYSRQAERYPGFAGYQEKTDRQIPVVSLSLQRGIPDDDLSRKPVHVNAEEDNDVAHVAVVGDTYTILVSGVDTGGSYTLIDMLVPPGGGPPPHRHDFEEMFTVLAGAIEVTCRGERSVARAGDTVNVPANAPHQFSNPFDETARLLCLCAPAGQDEFFMIVGDRVPSRTSPPPDLSPQEQQARMDRAVELAPRFRTELLLGDLDHGSSSGDRS
jgi:deazaflavin-dependent oxidoreductase (nitroreductase family)